MVIALCCLEGDCRSFLSSSRSEGRGQERGRVVFSQWWQGMRLIYTGARKLGGDDVEKPHRKSG